MQKIAFSDRKAEQTFPPEILSISQAQMELAQKMENLSKSSQEYLTLQKTLRQLNRKLKKIDPSGKNTPFQHLIWTHL